jgi:hypothetical protein
MSSVTQQQASRLAPGVAVMIRDAGLNCPRGETAEMLNNERKRQDEATRSQLIDKAGKGNLPQKLIVLAQPADNKENIYWESINDLLRFSAQVINDREPIHGTNILALFQTVKQQFDKIRDFTNAQFTNIFTEIVKHRLTEVRDEVIQRMDERIRSVVQYSGLNELRRRSPEDFAASLTNEFHTTFDDNANLAIPGAVQSQVAFVSECRANIQEKVKTQVDKIYFDRCFIDIVKPVISQTITTCENQINNAGTQILPQNVPGYVWGTLRNQIISPAVDSVRRELASLSPRLFQDQRYHDEENRLNSAIDTAIGKLENQKKSDYQTWKAEEDRKAQAERERKEREAKQVLVREQQRQEEEAKKKQELALQQKARTELLARKKLQHERLDLEWENKKLRAQSAHMIFANGGELPSWFLNGF